MCCAVIKEIMFGIVKEFDFRYKEELMKLGNMIGTTSQIDVDLGYD